MNKTGTNIVGIDLFAGAGGMSLGAEMAGINIILSIEKDKHAAATYKENHPETTLIVDDIAKVDQIEISCDDKIKILFGGAPCQGFSTSNQRTRSKDNPINWLFKEFIRIARLWQPDWIVFENVKGFEKTADGFFLNLVIHDLSKAGYTCSKGILTASDYGVPQARSRFFLIASRNGIKLDMPKPITESPITVKDALDDLPRLPNGARQNYAKYSKEVSTPYAQKLRNGHAGCNGHIVTKNSPMVIERYKHIPQGGNWENIPKRLMKNYTDRARCHTGIYHRLKEDVPSIVLGNYRKNMLIHPWENRGLSVREAARLQSFPDWYEFKGSIGYQQQQVGNAVPPLLAKAIFKSILV